MPKVAIRNTDIVFEIQEGETILAAADRQSIELPSGCGHGVCGVCISHIHAGRIDYPHGPPMALFDEDIEQNMGLCCVGTTSDDLEIEIVNFGEDFERWE